MSAQRYVFSLIYTQLTTKKMLNVQLHPLSSQRCIVYINKVRRKLYSTMAVLPDTRKRMVILPNSKL